MPLLWVVPLALYLLTFILAFSRRTFVSPRRAVWLQALLLVRRRRIATTDLIGDAG